MVFLLVSLLGFETLDKLFVPEDGLRSSLSVSLPLCLLTPLKRQYSRLSHSNGPVIWSEGEERKGKRKKRDKLVCRQYPLSEHEPMQGIHCHPCLPVTVRGWVTTCLHATYRSTVPTNHPRSCNVLLLSTHLLAGCSSDYGICHFQ
jgi:hypothetical protein